MFCVDSKIGAKLWGKCFSSINIIKQITSSSLFFLYAFIFVLKYGEYDVFIRKLDGKKIHEHEANDIYGNKYLEAKSISIYFSFKS